MSHRKVEYNEEKVLPKKHLKNLQANTVGRFVEIDAEDIETNEENDKIFCCFEVDLEADEVYDSEINPTEVDYKKVVWLYASNYKYPEDSIDYDKVGKWMLFVKPKWVNQVWRKIKLGIESGDLWDSKVTTNNPGRLHVIMIYTKDYTDVEDVIRVLDYIERSRLKPKYINIRYKADWQTRAGHYTGGKERPWIYASETIRGLALSNFKSSDADDLPPTPPISHPTKSLGSATNNP